MCPVAAILDAVALAREIGAVEGPIAATGSGAAEMRYLLKVVPCAHTALDGTVTPSSLFSVTEHTRQVQWRAGSRSSLPGFAVAAFAAVPRAPERLEVGAPANSAASAAARSPPRGSRVGHLGRD